MMDGGGSRRLMELDGFPRDAIHYALSRRSPGSRLFSCCGPIFALSPAVVWSLRLLSEVSQLLTPLLVLCISCVLPCVLVYAVTPAHFECVLFGNQHNLKKLSVAQENLHNSEEMAQKQFGIVNANKEVPCYASTGSV